jgi:F-type H+-transporting ATPase subunit delta
MIDYKVSHRYATSFLEMAEEKNILETIAVNVKLIYTVLKENPQLQRMLENPIIKSHIKISILEEIFKSKVTDETINFLKFVIHKNREDLIYSILQKFVELYDEKLGMVNVVVKTAFEFDNDQRELLKVKFEKFLNKKANIEFRLDENVVGGFIAKIGDTVYDASLRHQLELLKKQFLSTGISLN